MATNSGTNSGNDSDDSIEDLAVHMLHLVNIYEYWSTYIEKTPCHNSRLSGFEYLQELLNGHPNRIYNSLRMNKHVFISLCATLENHQLIQNDGQVCVQEVVAMFLFIVAHSVTSRIVAERFQHSTEIVHKQFKRVLKVICGLAPHIIRPRTQGETLPEIRENPKYYPYFQVSNKYIAFAIDIT